MSQRWQTSAVTGAVADNQGAHSKMADYIFTTVPGGQKLVADNKRFGEVATAGAAEEAGAIQ